MRKIFIALIAWFAVFQPAFSGGCDIVEHLPAVVAEDGEEYDFEFRGVKYRYPTIVHHYESCGSGRTAIIAWDGKSKPTADQIQRAMDEIKYNRSLGLDSSAGERRLAEMLAY